MIPPIDPEVTTNIHPVEKPRKGSSHYYFPVCLHCVDAITYLPKMSFPSFSPDLTFVEQSGSGKEGQESEKLNKKPIKGQKFNLNTGSV